MGTRLCAVSKFGNCTRTHVTRFGNTVGKPVPMAIPTCDTVVWVRELCCDLPKTRTTSVPAVPV